MFVITHIIAPCLSCINVALLLSRNTSVALILGSIFPSTLHGNPGSVSSVVSVFLKYWPVHSVN